jgi:hypothetical protein
MLNPNGASIYSAGLSEFADLIYEIVVTKAPKGKNVSKLWDKAFKALILLDALEDVDYYEEEDANPLYSCASEILEIGSSSDYPTPTQPVTIILNQGAQGERGEQGEKGDTGGGVDFNAGTISVTTVVDSFGIGEAYAAHWDYIVNNGAQRTGTIRATWLEDGSLIEYEDQSTADIGGTTAPVSFTVTYAGGVISLNAVIASGSWTISGTRYWIPGGGNYIPIDSTLTNGYLFIGNASNIPTERLISGDISIDSTGVAAIASNVIVNADVNSAANISLSKLASLTVDRVLVSNATTGKIDVGTPTITEINRVAGVTSAIQTQIDSKQATITGAASTVVSANLSASVALATNASGKIVDGGITVTEQNYSSGLTGNIQTQFGTKQDTITGAASSVTISNLTASRILVSDASGKIAASGTSSTSLAYSTSVIDIGDWNMDSTAFVTVAHGISSALTKIKSVSAAIYTDGGIAPTYNLLYEGAGGIYWDGALIRLSRVAASVFDSTNFDATGYNRGQITIIYEP